MHSPLNLLQHRSIRGMRSDIARANQIASETERSSLTEYRTINRMEKVFETALWLTEKERAKGALDKVRGVVTDKAERKAALEKLREAAKYYFEWSSAELSATCYGNECISLTLDDAESDPRFDEKLTVKVSIPYSWTSAILESYGETESLTIHTAEDGSHFVYANILPRIGNSMIRPAT